MSHRDDSSDDSFYVGYQRRAPAPLALFLRRAIGGLLLLVLFIAALLASQQNDFDPGVFEFGTVRDFEGILRETPVPALEVDFPMGRGERVASPSVYPLVQVGKHGATEVVAGRAGLRVRLRGTLIYREGITMIEIADDSLQTVDPVGSSARPAEPRPTLDAGSVTLIGEIVDSKCYLGVMKPGRTKSHRACAVRCLSGGIPPILVVESEAGDREHLFLVDAEGAALNDRILDRVAEPVRVVGELSRVGDQWILATDPETIERVAATTEDPS